MIANKKALINEDYKSKDNISRNSSYVKLFRTLSDWEWFTDVNVAHLFIFCLLRANYVDTEWRGIKIKKGSFLTSLENLAKSTGLTIRQVRTALTKLNSTSNLTSKGHAKYTVITVNNWDRYQQNDKQLDKQTTSKRQGSDKVATTDKKEKKEKNNKKDIILHIISNNKNYSKILTQEWQDLIFEWLDFKKGKNQSYKNEKSICVFIEKLLELSNNDFNTAKKIVNNSIANNWSGLYGLNQNQTNKPKGKDGWNL